jgi:hypothetical protein
LWDFELYLLLNASLYSGWGVLDFKDDAVEPLVLLTQLCDHGFNFCWDSEFDSLLSGFLAELTQSDFAFLDVAFSVDQVFVNFLDYMIEPVNFLKQDDPLKGHPGEFTFKFFRDDNNSIALDDLGLLRHAGFKLEDKVLSVD